ncbi:MAG: DUF2752 domain-containing protein [Candidatus Auribacterota bacterium]|nr:DUF2752 domain-containing protein [Candidatus Auribacterota bacterium]
MNTVKLCVKNEVRIISAVVMVSLAFVYAVSFMVPPSPEGVGTHVRFFLPPCALYKLTGLPCPFCGATTSFSLLAKGEFLKGLKANPFAVLVFVSGGFIFVYSLLCLVAGKAFKLDSVISLIKKGKWFIISALCISWIYKVLDMAGVF